MDSWESCWVVIRCQHTILICANQYGRAFWTGSNIGVGCHNDAIISPLLQLFKQVLCGIRRNIQDLGGWAVFSAISRVFDGVFGDDAVLVLHWWRLPTYQKARRTWASTPDVLRRGWWLWFYFGSCVENRGWIGEGIVKENKRNTNNGSISNKLKITKIIKQNRYP